MIPAGTPVIVTWDDAWMMGDDLEIPDGKPVQPAIETSIGFVVRDDRREREHPCIVIAMTKHAKDMGELLARHGQDPGHRDRLRIPRGMILSVVELKKGRKTDAFSHTEHKR